MAGATFVSAGVALIVCPLVSIFTSPPQAEKIKAVFQAKFTSDEEIDKKEVYHIIPKSAGGKISLAIFGLGVLVFLTGVGMGSQAIKISSLIAVVGMGIYFLGGFLRLYFE